MRRLSSLVAATLLLSPTNWGRDTVAGTVIQAALAVSALSVQPVQAQSAEEVAKIAQAITVRIEGATQGSGVIVKRAGNRYTVLTAWHVVEGQRAGEELAIVTSDGQSHQLEQGSIQRLGQVDLAVLTFSSPKTYELARIGDVKSVSSGSPVYVAGFPLPTSAVPSRIWRFVKGDMVANTTVAIPNGYRLLYSNPTLPGMSGGAVLDNQGMLVGIHGQGETDIKMTEQYGVAVKTGVSLGIPVNTLSAYLDMKGRDSNGRTGHLSQYNETSLSTQLVTSIPLQSGTEHQELYLLSESLANGRYRDADVETRRLLLGSGLAANILTEKAVVLINCGLLRRIDEQWTNYTKGVHGFRAQLERFQGSFNEFETIVQWRRGGFVTTTTDQGKNQPPGYFPRAVSNGSIHDKLLQRYRSCMAQG